MIMVASLGAVLYIAARVLPRVDEAEVDTVVPHTVVVRLTSYFERFDEWFAFISEKFLRRLRVILLKLDNVVTAKLGQFKKESNPMPQGIPDISKHEEEEKKEEKNGEGEVKEESKVEKKEKHKKKGAVDSAGEK